jgi:hypothetical protein
MGTKFWEVVCCEHGIGGSGEYCGDNDAHHGHINVFYHEALCGKYVPRAVLFDFEPIKIRESYARAHTGPKATTKRLSTNLSEPPVVQRLLW